MAVFGRQKPIAMGVNARKWFTCDLTLHHPYLEHSQDTLAVRRMTKYAHATKPVGDRRLLVEIQPPTDHGDARAMRAFAQTVGTHLSSGTLVLVRGWRPTEFTEFTLESFVVAGCSPDHQVCSQDMKTRAQGTKGRLNPYHYGTLRDLVDSADDPDRCLNLLDFSPNRLQCPFYVP
jgi:hypothetical protein